MKNKWGSILEWKIGKGGGEIYSVIKGKIYFDIHIFLYYLTFFLLLFFKYKDLFFYDIL